MSIFEEIKSIAKTLKEANKIPQYEQILGVQEKLLEMQNKISELGSKNKKLKEKLKIKEDLIYDKSRSSYWTKNGDGPFCSRCWDVKKNLVRLKSNIANLAFTSCPECKEQFQTDPSYKPPFTGERRS